MIWLIPILSLVVLVADWRVCHGNMNVRWNGFGAVESVIQGKAMLPMQYRVFVPWLTWLVGGGYWSYMLVKYCGIVFMFSSFHFYLGVLGVSQTLGTLALAAFLPITYMFDYADAYWDLGFLALAFGIILLGGNIWLLSVVVALSALNRETTVIIPVINAVLNFQWLVIVPFLVLSVGLLPRILYGRKPRYCRFNQIPGNLWSIRGDIKSLKVISGYLHTFLIAVGSILIILIFGETLSGLWIIGLGMTLLGVLISVPGKWNEVRIYLPMTLVLIPMVLK